MILRDLGKTQPNWTYCEISEYIRVRISKDRRGGETGFFRVLVASFRGANGSRTRAEKATTRRYSSVNHDLCEFDLTLLKLYWKRGRTALRLINDSATDVLLYQGPNDKQKPFRTQTICWHSFQPVIEVLIDNYLQKTLFQELHFVSLIHWLSLTSSVFIR